MSLLRFPSRRQNECLTSARKVAMVKAPTKDDPSKNGNVIGEMVSLTLSGVCAFTLLPASQKHLAHNALTIALAATRR